jgi:GNAT superfamily N-acetyltransferase
MDGFLVRPLTADDAGWVERFTIEHWGSPIVIAHGAAYQPAELPGFLALHEGVRAGLVTYRKSDEDFEIVTLNSLSPELGIGSALLSAVLEVARRTPVGRVWLITTNDNIKALAFYQKRGFQLAALHRNALEKSRALKPRIPLIGMNGIPIRDEIELEYIIER